MSTLTLYYVVASAVIAAGLYGIWTRTHLVQKLVAANVLGTGVFVILIALGRRTDPPDPIPHALVLTGIVVAVSVTAFSLFLVRRIRRETESATLPEEREDYDG